MTNKENEFLSAATTATGCVLNAIANREEIAYACFAPEYGEYYYYLQNKRAEKPEKHFIARKPERLNDGFTYFQNHLIELNQILHQIFAD